MFEERGLILRLSVVRTPGLMAKFDVTVELHGGARHDYLALDGHHVQVLWDAMCEGRPVKFMFHQEGE